MASAAYNRRNARARALGYRSYYDYRLHDSGARPPSDPITAAMRAANRGHRSFADLTRALRGVEPGGAQVAPLGLNRDAKGRWTEIDVLVLYPDGSERRYVLRGKQASTANLERLRASLAAAGVTYLAAPSIDVFSGESESEIAGEAA